MLDPFWESIIMLYDGSSSLVRFSEEMLVGSLDGANLFGFY
jgi:hypothetical protein